MHIILHLEVFNTTSLFEHNDIACDAVLQFCFSGNSRFYKECCGNNFVYWFEQKLHGLVEKFNFLVKK